MSDVIRVAIGTEKKQRVPCEVLKHSIRRRTSRTVEFLESWTADGGWHPAMKASPQIANGTAFSTWRWVAPSVYGEGRAIYLDADQVVLADIGELWDTPLDGKIVAAVCNAQGVFGKKTPEPNKVQTSVMLMDCDRMFPHAEWALLECAKGRMPYRDLMQAAFLPRSEVVELLPQWNYFGIAPPDAKLVHWSHVKSQPWCHNTEHPTAHVWAAELRHAVAAGVLTIKDLQHEAKRGHIHDVYWQRLTA